jgi:hypothetical protein
MEVGKPDIFVLGPHFSGFRVYQALTNRIERGGMRMVSHNRWSRR